MMTPQEERDLEFLSHMRKFRNIPFVFMPRVCSARSLEEKIRLAVAARMSFPLFAVPLGHGKVRGEGQDEWNRRLLDECDIGVLILRSEESIEIGLHLAELERRGLPVLVFAQKEHRAHAALRANLAQRGLKPVYGQWENESVERTADSIVAYVEGWLRISYPSWRVAHPRDGAAEDFSIESPIKKCLAACA